MIAAIHPETVFFIILGILGFGFFALMRAAAIIENRMDKDDEDCLEDEDMKETQRLEP